MKRLRSELESEGAFNQVPFNYDDKNNDVRDNKEELEPNDYKVPESLVLPVGLNLPTSMKQHTVIEKTALFISKTGPQTEIRLKIQHASNESFAFLDLDCPLNQYFRYLLSVIKSGKYVPDTVQESEAKTPKNNHESDSDSDSDGDYLHPSLLASRSTVTSTIVQDNAKTPSDQPLRSVSHELNKTMSLLAPPPPALEAIIEKLAEKVAAAGDVFESSIRSRGDTRFDFLQPGHAFHAHYVKRKIHHLQQNHLKRLISPTTSKKDNEVKTLEKEPKETIEDKKSVKMLSFHVKPKNTDLIKTTPRTTACSEIEDPDDEITKLIESAATTTAKNLELENDDDDDKIKRDKELLQEERKRKAARFLKMVQQRDEGSIDDVTPDGNSTEESIASKAVLAFTTSDVNLRKESGRRRSGESSSSSRDKKKRKRSRSRERSRHRDSRDHRRRRSPS